MLLWFQSFLFRLLSRAATSLLPHQLKPDRQWEAEGRWNSTSGALFFPGNRGSQIIAVTPLHCVSASSLASASICTNHSGWNTASTPLSSLDYWIGDVNHPSTATVLAGAVVSLWLNLQLPFLSSLPSCFSCLLPYAHLQISQCLRYICVLNRKSFVKL